MVSLWCVWLLCLSSVVIKVWCRMIECFGLVWGIVECSSLIFVLVLLVVWVEVRVVLISLLFLGVVEIILVYRVDVVWWCFW